MRFALGVDDDLTEFARTFRGDPLIGEIIHHRPWLRPRRRPWPWEALAWAVTEQLIEARGGRDQRRVVRRWGAKLMPPASSASRPGAAGSGAASLGPGPLRDVPSAEEVIAGWPRRSSPPSISPSRAIALIRCAREVAAGRVDPGCPSGTPACGGSPASGPGPSRCSASPAVASPLAARRGPHVKLVGALARLGRRATVEEDAEYFEPYAPFRGLAGSFALARWHGAVGQGPPLARAA